jgi:Tfp pilus assembly protein PilX
MRFSWKDEAGFALIAAMMAILILTGVGILVFMISTQDIRISGRLVGEKKAVSAAEAGAHSLSTTFNPSNLASNAVANVPVDSANDPGSQYSIGTPARPASGTALLPMTGYSQSGGQQWGQARYNAPITGANTTYRSNVQVNLGIGYGPVEMTTTYR